MDLQWWKKYATDVDRVFVGERFSNNPIPAQCKVTRLKINAYGNSGIGALATAVHAKAKAIIMLGYDVQKTEGKAHWHGDHPQGLGNAGKIENWPEKFARFARMQPANIINASRETALTCFSRMSLDEALKSLVAG